MSKHAKTQREPTHEEIAARAQGIYEREGRPEGKAMQHWLQAEAQLKMELKAQPQAAAATGDGHTATAGTQVAAAGMRGPNWQTTPRQPVTRN
jgi:hypothetical protein